MVQKDHIICSKCGYRFERVGTNKHCSNCIVCTGCEIYYCPSPVTKRLLLLQSGPCVAPQKIKKRLIYDTKPVMPDTFDGSKKTGAVTKLDVLRLEYMVSAKFRSFQAGVSFRSIFNCSILPGLLQKTGPGCIFRIRFTFRYSTL
jgi:hypothetical protein